MSGSGLTSHKTRTTLSSSICVEYLCHDKGYGWRVTGPLGDVVNPVGMRTIGDFPNLTAALEHADWPETKIRKVMGENWLRLLTEVWGE